MASSSLDQIRRNLGIDPEIPRVRPRTPATAGPTLGSVVAAGGPPASRYSDEVRTWLAVTIVLGGLDAALHQLVYSAMAHSGGLYQYGAALLGWPAPLAQTIIVAATTLVLLFSALATGGFTKVGAAAGPATVVASIVSDVALIPAAIVLAAAALAVALMIVAGILLLFICFAALAEMLK
jgi:hypothetical protein